MKFPTMSFANDRETVKRSKAAENTLDMELIRRYLRGDKSAFKELMSRHWDEIYRTSFRLLGDTGEAEEVTQDTFIRIHRGVGGFRGESAFTTWAHSIVSNLSRNRYWYWLRRRKRDHIPIDAPVSNDPGNTLTLAETLPGKELSPVDNAKVAELAREIDKAMGRISVKHHEILTLRNQLEMPYDKIAEILGISLGTVKSRIARARECLHAKLEEKT